MIWKDFCKIWTEQGLKMSCTDTTHLFMLTELGSIPLHIQKQWITRAWNLDVCIVGLTSLIMTHFSSIKRARDTFSQKVKLQKWQRVVRKERRLALPLTRTEGTLVVFTTHKGTWSSTLGPHLFYPRRRNVTTLMVGLKDGHICKNLTQK